MKQTNASILGVRVTPLTYQAALDTIFSWVAKKQRQFVCVAAVHLIMECQRDSQLRSDVNGAGLVTPDGMPLVWLLRLAGQRTERVYGPDLMLKVCARAAEEGRSVFLLGGRTGQSARLAAILRHQFPGLSIAGHADTPVRPLPAARNAALVRRIRASKAEIVFVGLGCPLQERWMRDHSPQLNSVLIGVGAAFDFLSGQVRQAPRWMMALGLEWLFRLAQEPRRLAKRSLVLNSQFLFLLALRAVSKKRLLSVLALVLVLVGAGVAYAARPVGWQFYSARSIGPNNTLEIFDNLIFDQQRVIFNSQDGRTTALQQTSGALAWQFTAQDYSPFPATVSGDRLYLANFDATIYCLDRESGQELWRFAIPDGADPDTPVLASSNGTTVYVATRAGTLFALAADSGRVLWTRQFAAPDQTRAFVENTIHFGSLQADDERLYAFNAPENALVALRQTDGQEIWRVNNLRFTFQAPIITADFVIILQADSLRIVRAADGATVTLERHSADGPWHALSPDPANNALLVIDGQELAKIDLSTGEKTWTVPGVTVGWAGAQTKSQQTPSRLHGDTVLAQRFDTLNGRTTLIALDFSTGQTQWELTLPTNIVVSETQLGPLLILGEKTGHILAVEHSSGRLLWQTKLPGEILAVQPALPWLAVATADSSQKPNLFLLDAQQKGTVLWHYTPDNVVRPANIFLHGQAAYLLDEQRHLLEKIELTRRSPEQHSLKKLNFSTEQKTDQHDPFVERAPKTPLQWKWQTSWLQGRLVVQNIGATRRFALTEKNEPGLLELTISHDQQVYTNPFTALDLQAEFVDRQTGDKFRLRGYYFDKNTWKLAFRAPHDGRYSWRLTAASRFATKTWTGVSELGADETPPLVVDGDSFAAGGNAVFPLGLQNSFTDRNYDGRVTDQLPDAALAAPSEEPADFRYLSLDSYLDLFVDQAGLNFFRYGVDNFAPPLYQSLAPDDIRWDVAGGRFGDQLLEKLRSRHVRVMMTLFGFYPPFDSKEEMHNPAHRRAVATYLDYVIARFSHQVDVWEIGNEARSDRAWYDFVLEHLQKNDPYHHPISTNWEMPNLQQTDFVSLHWYNQNTASPAQLHDSVRFLRTSVSDSRQPVIISEFGFKNASWFPGSSTAVRVFSWLATFEKMGIIFWNQGQNGISRNPANANVYLGPTERAGLLALTRFLPTLKLPVTTDAIALPGGTVRASILKNEAYYLAYLIKLSPPATPVMLPVTLDRGATLEWIDPATGRQVAAETLTAGEHRLAVPDFETDIAVKITYAANTP